MAFYLFFVILGVATAVAGVAWNRRYTRRLRVREYRKALRQELGVEPYETFRFKR